MFLLETPLDTRDYLYEECITGSAQTKELPVSYKSAYTRVENQGYSGHCVSYAFTSGMEIKQMMVTGSNQVAELSRLFLQSECKLVDGYPRQEGTTMRAALKVLQKLGVCEEHYYPWIYNEEIKKNIFPKKTAALYDNAKRYRIANYARVSRDIEAIKRAIYNESCVFLSNRCFGQYQTSYKGHTYPPSGSYYGNHATVLIGWDDEHECSYKGRTYKGFLIRLNSYGTDYFANGEEYIPYEAINSWQLRGDAWFVEAWTAISQQALNDPDYHKLRSQSPAINPKYDEMKLTIGSKIIWVNGLQKLMDVAPRLINGTTFVPIRFFVDHFKDTTCSWNQLQKEVSVTHVHTGKKFVFKIGSCHVKDRNGQIIYTLLEAPFIENNRTMLPVRAYSELLGAKVEYRGETKEIIITM